MNCGRRTSDAIASFRFREDSFNETLAKSIDRALDACHFNDVDANCEDHLMTTDGDAVTIFELREGDGTSWLTCLPFEDQGFVAAFGTRVGTVAGESADVTAERLVAALGLGNARLSMAKQVHSAVVRVLATDRDLSEIARAECDAMTTARRGTLLGIKTADCVPVFIADTRTRAIAVAHAGWRGAVARIVERTFATMVAKHGARRADCIAAIGPAISAQAYEVGAEVLARFQSEFPYASRIVSNVHDDKGHIDLKEACAIQLELCGLDREQIFVSDACTMSEPERWFSYRREGVAAGRIVSILGEAAPQT